MMGHDCARDSAPRPSSTSFKLASEEEEEDDEEEEHCPRKEQCAGGSGGSLLQEEHEDALVTPESCEPSRSVEAHDD